MATCGAASLSTGGVGPGEPDRPRCFLVLPCRAAADASRLCGSGGGHGPSSCVAAGSDSASFQPALLFAVAASGLGDLVVGDAVADERASLAARACGALPICDGLRGDGDGQPLPG